MNCRDQRPFLLRNGGNDSNWLALDLTGSESSRDAIGARVRVRVDGGREQHLTVSTAGSYLSSGDRRLHFGLGTAEAAALVEIEWPSGTVQLLENVPANQILEVRERTGR